MVDASNDPTVFSMVDAFNDPTVIHGRCFHDPLRLAACCTQHLGRSGLVMWDQPGLVGHNANISIYVQWLSEEWVERQGEGPGCLGGDQGRERGVQGEMGWEVTSWRGAKQGVGLV